MKVIKNKPRIIKHPSRHAPFTHYNNAMNKLIKMILESKSIEPEEKQERINLLEVMQPEHLQRLKDILSREKKLLKKTQDKYDKEKKKVINKTIKDNNLTSIMAV